MLIKSWQLSKPIFFNLEKMKRKNNAQDEPKINNEKSLDLLPKSNESADITHSADEHADSIDTVAESTDTIEIVDENIEISVTEEIQSNITEELLKSLAILDTDDERTVTNKILATFLLSIKKTTLRDAAGILDDVPITERMMIVIVIDYLVDVAIQLGWALARFDDSYYLYTGTHWQRIQSDDLKEFLGKSSVLIGVDYYMAKHYKFKENLQLQFYSAGYFQSPVTDSMETLINLKNGTFVFSITGSYLKDFDKADFIRYKLPFAYDPEAECPKFIAYINRVLPDKEKQMVIAEFLGYVFIRNSLLKLEKSLILYGSGANGKSVLFDIIQKLLGPDNVSNFSLQSLTDPNGYTRSLLTGKLLNYASEISSKMNPTLFKQLVSGEPVEARMIYGKPFILRDYARFIFNTNVLPADVENNPGFFRRFIIIEFDQTIADEEKNPMLANEIIQEELPGVFNWVLEGMNRLLKQGDFSKCAAASNAIESYRKESDSVALFLDDGGFKPSLDDKLSLMDFYNKYKDFCKDSNYTCCSSKIFSTRLKVYGYEITRISAGRLVGVKKVL
jgi:putative DNA primase/helicase